METAKPAPTQDSKSPVDEHWNRFCELVEGGRLALTPAGLDTAAIATFPWKRHGKRALAIALMAGLGGAAGWIFGSAVLGTSIAFVLVATFVWILIAGAPDPFHEAYLKNPTLFERSYLSGAIFILDRKTREVHQYPTEWRRIVTEIDGG